jgi:hypothetical protein
MTVTDARSERLFQVEMFETNLQQRRVASHPADAVNCGILSTRGTQNGKEKACKALFGGSIPSRTSNFLLIN